MNVKLLHLAVDWLRVKQIALSTIRKTTKELPTSIWKRQILLAEHSPIRFLRITAKFENLKYWISVHLVRHKIGIEHFVTTQRDDRTQTDRDVSSQSALVDHIIDADIQAIINISRKRLCSAAHNDTRAAWLSFIDSFKTIEPEIYQACVPECIYRGHCFEFQSCGYYKTKAFKIRLKQYRKGIND